MRQSKVRPGQQRKKCENMAGNVEELGTMSNRFLAESYFIKLIVQ